MDTNNTNPIPQNTGAPTYAERLQKLAVDDAYWNGYYKGAWKGLATGMIISGLIVIAGTFLIKAGNEVKDKEEETND